MNIAEICKARHLGSSVNTPLVVPSFSSRGFPDLASLNQVLRDYVPDESLISAYDVHYGYLAEEEIYSSDVVFIDSGGYEARPVYDVGEAYIESGQARHGHWKLTKPPWHDCGHSPILLR